MGGASFTHERIGVTCEKLGWSSLSHAFGEADLALGQFVEHKPCTPPSFAEL